MKTQWDYTDLAQAYLKRPDYADAAIDGMLERGRLTRGAAACDVGAGVAHLTLKLLERGLRVVPVEPNDEMRRLGAERTRAVYPETLWVEGKAQNGIEAALVRPIGKTARALTSAKVLVSASMRRGERAAALGRQSAAVLRTVTGLQRQLRNNPLGQAEH